MEEHDQEQGEQEQDQQSHGTSPDADRTSDASSPPGGGERDEEAIKRSEEGLDQAGGGH